MKNNNKEPIELRKIITPNDSLYEFVSQIKDFLLTDSPSGLLDFILKRASKIPIDEFIHLSNIKDNKSDTQTQEKSINAI